MTVLAGVQGARTWRGCFWRVAFRWVIAYGRRLRMPGGLSPRSALLDVGIGVVALALSLVFGRPAALSQPVTRPLDALGYALVVVSRGGGERAGAPVPVLGVVAAALVVFAVRDYPGGPASAWTGCSAR